jgi:hypothetical protein
LVGMLTNFGRCHLHTYNLERFIFVSQNWRNNFMITSFPTNLVKYVEANVKLKDELKSLKDLLMEMKLWTCKQIFMLFFLFFFTLIFTFKKRVLIIFFWQNMWIQNVNIQNNIQLVNNNRYPINRYPNRIKNLNKWYLTQLFIYLVLWFG